MLLANHFAARIAYELGREEVIVFSEKALEALEKYSWKGNVRELKNVIERAVYRSDETVIDEIVFDPFTSPYDSLREEERGQEPVIAVEHKAEKETASFKDTVKSFEIELIQKALSLAHNHQKRAAEDMGLTYDQFRGLIRKYSEELAGKGKQSWI